MGRHKNPGLGLNDRITLAREALDHMPDVEVEGFDGRVVDFAARRGASVIMRGLRTEADVLGFSRRRHLNPRSSEAEQKARERYGQNR